MQNHFSIPPELRAVWRHLSWLYRAYLPEIHMERDSFVATPAEAQAILAQLFEMTETGTRSLPGEGSRRAFSPPSAFVSSSF
jgi:hypothetical protein